MGQRVRWCGSGSKGKDHRVTESRLVLDANEMTSQKKLDHSPVLRSMGQKSPQLPYFEKVQHLKEKSWAKTFFAKVISAMAKVYLREKHFEGLWHFKIKCRNMVSISEVKPLFKPFWMGLISGWVTIWINLLSCNPWEVRLA